MINLNRLFPFCFTLIALALVWSACSSQPAASTGSLDELVAQIPSPYTEDAQAPGTFIGEVPGADFFIGIVVQDGQAVAYLCDGVDIGDWFKGALTGEQIDLTNKSGSHLQATHTATAVTGTVTLPGGESFAFSASPAVEGVSGLYRDHETIEGVVYTLGWVVTQTGLRGLSEDEAGGGKNSIAVVILPIAGGGGGGGGGNTVLPTPEPVNELSICQNIGNNIKNDKELLKILNNKLIKTKALKEQIGFVEDRLANNQKDFDSLGCK